MTTVERRIVLHFPGFEPLDAAAHHARYLRSARQSAPHFDMAIEVGPLKESGAAPVFDVVGRTSASRTDSRIHLFGYDRLIGEINGRPVPARLSSGFLSAARVVAEGGLAGYFRHGWRFALFFLFPFVLTLIALALSLALTLLPLALGASPAYLLLSLPLAALLFARVFLPLSGRWHVLHLFGDWDLALELARLRDPRLAAWVAAAVPAARAALAEEADEILVTSHSMGSGMAALVLGALIEAEPEALKGRRLVFLTLGGAILQSALLRSAKVLRARVGAIARAPEVLWIEVQCLNDVVHFYRSKVVAACGHASAPEARLVLVRFKHMLTPEHLRRIRRDVLRVHRQYVLGSDRPSVFDFARLTAGPAPASSLGAPQAADGKQARAEAAAL